MACKITHRVTDQQIRFANRDAAERYAEIMGGGVHNWVFTTVPNSAGATAAPVEPSYGVHRRLAGDGLRRPLVTT